MTIAIRSLVAFALVLGLSACVAPGAATRNAPMQAVSDLSVASKDGVLAVTPAYDVADVRITVPTSLKVSEANLFYPVADIVWRGEPVGDRYAQITQILREAAAGGTAGMNKGQKIVLDITLTRFHSLTEKTRFTVGGMHTLRYDLTVRDAATGTILSGPQKIVADVRGAGGNAAIAEEMAGRTQRVVVIEALGASLRRALSAPRPVPGGDAVSQNMTPDLIGSVTQVY
jgi:hypothetical protein